jgi:RNA polymerase sigma factor (sigma-70 family)
VSRRDDDGNLVRLYLQQLGAEPLLTKEDEEALARAIETGAEAATRLLVEGTPADASVRMTLEEAVAAGHTARQRFVRANLRLVVSVARHWTRSGLPLLDLIQEGNLGLLRAVDRFDYRRGFRFSTYATWWIRQAIRRAVANTGRLVRLPVHTGDAVASVVRELHRLEERPRPDVPPIEAIADATGLSTDKVSMLLRLAPAPTSIFEPIGEDGEDLGALIADTAATSPVDAALAELVSIEVDRLLGTLAVRDRLVMAMRFGLGGGEPCSMDAIARTLGLSREGVRQSHARALRTLRRAAGASPEIRQLLSA